VVDPTRPCPPDDDLVDLALGMLDGRERADTLAHLTGCEACRDRVGDLAGTVEAVLAAAPAGDPPLGFERAVLDRVRAASGGRAPADLAGGPSGAPLPTPITARPRTGRARAMRVAAIAAAVVLIAAISVVAGTRWGRSSGVREQVAEAAMVTPSGREVGTVWRYDGDPSWVFVSVPGWTAWEGQGGPGDDGRRYRLVASLEDGTQADLGEISFAAGGSWGTSTTVPAGSVRRVAITDDTGRTWCEGEF
jgi:hypothetical protein